MAAKHAPAESMERATSIAARLTGLRPSGIAIRVSVLSIENRALVRLHEVLPADHPESGSPLLRMIEKGSARPQEYEFFRFIAGREAHGEEPPAPKLYEAVDLGFTLRNHRRYVIFLEHVERLDPGRSPELAADLARRISRISSLAMPREFRPRRALQLSAELLSQFIDQVEPTPAMRDRNTRKRLGEMAAGWPQILSVRNLDLPRVPCHNDLHADNVRFRTAMDGSRETVFIDWEAFGWNYPGADLHHFVHETAARPNLAPFLDALLSTYVEHTRRNYAIDARQVDLAAHSYALTRAMCRVIRKPHRRDLHLSLRIYERLRERLVSA